MTDKEAVPILTAEQERAFRASYATDLPNADFSRPIWDVERALFKRGWDAATVQPAAAQGWQPIETAPRDGTHVLLWHVGKYNAYRTIGSAQSDHPVEAGRGWCDLGARALSPTLWAPLLPSP